MTDAIQRAEHAKRLLDDDLVKEALVYMRATILGDWEATQPPDAAKREDLYQLRRAISRFEEFFRAVIESGAVEQERIRLERAQSINMGRI